MEATNPTDRAGTGAAIVPGGTGTRDVACTPRSDLVATVANTLPRQHGLARRSYGQQLSTNSGLIFELDGEPSAPPRPSSVN